MVKQIEDLNNQLIIDRNIYNVKIIHKCLYWYGDKISFDVKTENNSIVITLPDGLDEEEIRKIKDKIRTDLIDHKTREIISDETHNIREILIAKAFADSDEFDESPPGDVSDPVGFDPSTI
ncbi:His-Xaa-Ser system protein HxsD [Candidatus Neomarinimicrobiota bacterium]